jgi:hypothetical protein
MTKNKICLTKVNYIKDMKQSIYFTILVFLLISCSSHQQEKSALPKAKSNLEEENIKGQVAVIVAESYDAKEKFGVIEPVKLRNPVTTVSKYNLNGNLLRETSIQETSIDESTITQEKKYVYDKGDKLISSEFTTPNEVYNIRKHLTHSRLGIVSYDSIDYKFLSFFTKYKYNNDNTLAEIMNYSPNGLKTSSTEWSYNEDKKILSFRKKKYNRDNKDDPDRITSMFVATTRNIYDEYGKLYSQIYSDDSFDQSIDANIIAKFGYDNKGNITSQKTTAYFERKFIHPNTFVHIGKIIFNLSNDKNSVYIDDYNTWEYDNFNNIIISDLIGEEQKKSFYKYEYDKQGNWIKKVTYDNFEQPIKIEVRKIQYYSTDPNQPETDKTKETKTFDLERSFLIDLKRSILNDVKNIDIMFDNLSN